MINVAVLFEGRNFYAGSKAWARDRVVDFKGLLGLIAEQTQGEIKSATYYMGVDQNDVLPEESSERIKNAIKDLEASGIAVRTFPLRLKVSTCPACDEDFDDIIEKQVDSAISVDAMKLMYDGANAKDGDDTHKIDLFALVSSDTDLIPLAQAVKAAGKRVWIVCWKPESVSNSLASCVENIMVLDPHRERFLRDIVPIVVSTEMLTSFLTEVESAEQQFSTGYVGLHYFLRGWKSPELPEQIADRSTVLNQLIASGSILQYDAPDGNIAIKRAR